VFVLSIGASWSACSRKGTDAGGTPTTTSNAPTAPAPMLANSVPAGPGEQSAAKTPGKLPGQGATCEDDRCEAGLECIKYYGFAGPAGPQFTACEVRCQVDGKPTCPSGQNCVIISDGPGSVCRPPDM
jgi:hypothetical protein